MKKINVSPKKKILITGANSYIGTSVERWLNNQEGSYEVDTLDLKNEKWTRYDFSSYDVIYHVAGIAHADTGRVTEETKKLYYSVNTDLAIKVAKKAKEEGVNQFIFMSSMIVYSGCKQDIITSDTIPVPLNFYGDSKLQADIQLEKLRDDSFKVVILRPPMIYGKGSKGNYPRLAKLASRLWLFPMVKNERSMLHIDNLCEFVKLMIDNQESGIFFPQNSEYVNTSNMVKQIAEVKKHKIHIVKGFNWCIKLITRCPGKIGNITSKVFGSSIYSKEMSIYKNGDYQIRTFEESIQLTEGEI